MSTTIGDPLLSRTLSLPHQLLQFFEACTTAPERKGLLASLLRQDPALLANFLDAASGLQPVLPQQSSGNDWLIALLDALPETALQQFALNAADPWLTLELEEPHWLLLRELHHRSHCVAGISRILAGHIEGVDPDEAWLAGMMHNLGKLMLFSLSPARFQSAGSPVILGAEALEGERKLWGTDHLDVATARIRLWPLDSFLCDAVTLIYEQPDDYQSATALVRILHGAEQLSHLDDPEEQQARSPGHLLGIEPQALQSTLFQGRDAARQLKWYQLEEPAFCARQREAVVELRRAVGALANRAIDQTELYHSDSEDALIDTAIRQLRRHFGSALVFTLSDDRRLLVGQPTADQPRRVAQMRARFQPGDNLPAHALIENEVVDSINAEEFALSLFDRQLSALIGGEGFCCLPLKHRQTPVGVAVVRLADAGQPAMARDPRVRGTLDTLTRLLAVSRSGAGGNGVESTSSLVREMYHELSNPLTAVRNHLYVLKRRLDDEGRETLARVEDDLTRLGDLLGQYRQRAHNQRHAPEATDINQLARETIARVASSCDQARTIEADLDESLPAINTNRLAIQQILTNLLTNALEATRNGERVSVSTCGNARVGEQQYVEIAVMDDGPGIPEPVMQNLFRPVTSTKGGDHSGLGLNIVKSLADEIGAIIQCHSSNEGTGFQLLVPRQPTQFNNNEKKRHETFSRQSLPES